MKEKKSFLVFSGGNDRAVLGFLRALRSCGEHASIVARTNQDRILWTSFRQDVKWIRKSHELSLQVFAECVRAVREHVGSHTLVVLPSTEYFNTFLLKYRAAIESMGCEIPLVESELYNLLTGKLSSADQFLAAGFSIPRELDNSFSGTQPLVAKPRHNVSREDRSLYPHLLMTHGDLETFHEKNDPADYFFQEYVVGESLYLLFYIARDGRRFTWSQRNLMQQPDGKSMLLAEPAEFHLSATANRLIKFLCSIKFSGLGMIEVIKSADREVFIEMNPRIWGPVQLCVDQGQPLLHAFIGDVLHNDPSHFVALARRTRLKRQNYCWLGGIVDTLGAGRKPLLHTSKISFIKLAYVALRNDIYLRRDSWKCFLRELKTTIKLVLRRERT